MSKITTLSRGQHRIALLMIVAVIISIASFEAVALDNVAFTETPPENTYNRYASFAIESSSTDLSCRLDDTAFEACQTQVFYTDVGEGSHTFTVKDNSTGEEISFSWTVISVFESNSVDVIPATQIPNKAEPRSWRGIIRINCDFSHSSYNDPIVFPDEEGAAHLHRFYGNTLIDHTTTLESIITTGDSTCQGDELNRSAYWIPALLAPEYDLVTGERLLDDDGNPAWTAVPAVVGTNEEAHEVFYYSAGVDDLDSIQPVPVGLRMIAGNAKATLSDTQDTSIVRWHCQSWESNDANNPRWSATIPECSAPDRVRLDIFFPSCWNGVDLDSPDHKSHMAYPIRDSDTGEMVCPSSHPVPIVRPSYHYAFGVRPEVFDPVTRSSTGWRLSSDSYTVTAEAQGGASLHGDWFNAWHPEVMEAMLETCIQQAYDCHNGNLANGWRLSEAQEGIQNEPAIINDGHGHH